MIELSDHEFARVQAFIYQAAGISLADGKKVLVSGRLEKRLRHHRLASFGDYLRLIAQPLNAAERQVAIDELTTNETYFFREPQHFDFLSKMVAGTRAGAPTFRVWSAASSSGEEAYSIAMLLADKIGPRGWEIVGTDLSTQMVDSGRRALYTLERARNVPQPYLKKWCLKGEGQYDGYLLISKELRANVRFQGANLTQDLPDIGLFDVIFLRNVLIYFDNPGKEDIVRRVITRLKPGGYLFTGHAESLANLNVPLQTIAPAVYAPA